MMRLLSFFRKNNQENETKNNNIPLADYKISFTSTAAVLTANIWEVHLCPFLEYEELLSLLTINKYYQQPTQAHLEKHFPIEYFEKQAREIHSVKQKRNTCRRNSLYAFFALSSTGLFFASLPTLHHYSRIRYWKDQYSSFQAKPYYCIAYDQPIFSPYFIPNLNITAENCKPDPRDHDSKTCSRIVDDYYLFKSTVYRYITIKGDCDTELTDCPTTPCSIKEQYIKWYGVSQSNNLTTSYIEFIQEPSPCKDIRTQLNSYRCEGAPLFTEPVAMTIMYMSEVFLLFILLTDIYFKAQSEMQMKDLPENLSNEIFTLYRKTIQEECKNNGSYPSTDEAIRDRFNKISIRNMRYEICYFKPKGRDLDTKPNDITLSRSNNLSV